MYDVHLGLMGKRVVDLLLVIIELFSLGVTVLARGCSGCTCTPRALKKKFCRPILQENV